MEGYQVRDVLLNHCYFFGTHPKAPTGFKKAGTDYRVWIGLKPNVLLEELEFKSLVKDLISEGKPVPSEVMKDYPDLKSLVKATKGIKAPWTMTKDEYWDWISKQIKNEAKKQGARLGPRGEYLSPKDREIYIKAHEAVVKRIGDQAKSLPDALKFHKQSVRQAFIKGKSIPRRVLEEYKGEKDFLDLFKKETGKITSPALAANIFAGVTGAAVGGLTDKEHRLRNALAGAGVGIAVLHGGKLLLRHKPLDLVDEIDPKKVITKDISGKPLELTHELTDKEVKKILDLTDAIPSTKTPPAERYIKTKDIPKYAGSLNVHRATTDDEIKLLFHKVYQLEQKRINRLRGKKITLKQSQEMADELGWTYEDLAKMQKKLGLSNLHVYTSATRQLTKASILDLATRLKRWKVRPTEENLAKALLAYNRHVRVQAITSQMATALGRSMVVLKEIPKDIKLKERVIKRIIEANGGKALTKEKMKVMTDILNDDVIDFGAANRLIRDLSKSTTIDKIHGAWVNFLLSGLKTSFVNSLSNTLTATFRVPEKLGAAGIDILDNIITGAPREIRAGEAWHEAVGLITALPEAWRVFKRAIKTGLPSEAWTKLEGARIEPIKGKAGKIISIPGRLLVAEDEFFKALNYRATIRGRAYREAVNKGLKGKAKEAYIYNRVQNPSEPLQEVGFEDALYRTFQSLSELASWITTGKQKKNWGPILKFIVPFTRTPVNIAKYGIERTPLELAALMAGKTFKGGTIGKLTRAEVKEQIGKALMGSILGLTTVLRKRLIHFLP
jgi:hypothetical protein